jgi:site-specific recombinase XerD
MSSLAPTLERFFTDRLMLQRHVSANTVAAYRDTFRLLLSYLRVATGKAPCKLDLQDLDAHTVTGFLQHLEITRHNGVRTRNARLSAIHSFFEYAALLHPEHAELIQRVLAIPEKRFDTALVSYLTPLEIDALLAGPDRSTWTGQRDYTLLLLAVQTGLRVSELVGLCRQDVELGVGAHVRCRGKGRKERCTPITKTTAGIVRIWMRTHNGSIDDPLFPSRGTDRRLTRGAIWRSVANYAAIASRRCPSLAAKHVTPHVLRHTAAMTLLHAGVDLATIALWLGHESIESTNVYLHADMALKERALARTAPAGARVGRYHASDELLAFLDHL